MNEPTKTSLKKIIREHLEQGNQLTVLSCFKLCCTNELRHFVSELKNEGMEIDSHWEYNDKKKWKVYYIADKLKPKVINQAMQEAYNTQTEPFVGYFK